MTVLNMEFSIVEKLSGPRERVFAYLESLNSTLVKIKENVEFIKLPSFQLLAHVELFGVLCCCHSACPSSAVVMGCSRDQGL